MSALRIARWSIFLLLGVGGAVAAADAPAGTAPPPAAAQKPLPVALVDALNVLSHGPHKGFRANHAKGVMVEGTFTAAPTAAAFSQAPHFKKTVPVLVRFSDTTGVPTLPDADPNASPHGIAIRFICFPNPRRLR